MKEVYHNVRGKRLASLATIIILLGFMTSVGVPVFAASGADYPSKPVLFYCMGTQGGGFDTTLRAIANILSKEKMVPVPMPIENAPSTAIAVPVTVTRFKGDPYMISLQSLAGMMNYAAGVIPYSHKDFTPLCGLYSVYYGLAVRYDSPYKTLGDLIKDLKEKPGEVHFCGGPSEDRIFYGATFMKAGLDPRKINYVAFHPSEACMSVLEGSCKVIAVTLDEVTPLVEGKKLRLLAVSSGERLGGSVFKDVPTVRELGIDFEFANGRYALGGPAMPEYAVKYWRNTFAKMVKTPAWQEILKRYQWSDGFQIEGFNDVLDKRQAVFTEMVAKLGMAKK